MWVTADMGQWFLYAHVAILSSLDSTVFIHPARSMLLSPALMVHRCGIVCVGEGLRNGGKNRTCQLKISVLYSSAYGVFFFLNPNDYLQYRVFQAAQKQSVPSNAGDLTSRVFGNLSKCKCVCGRCVKWPDGKKVIYMCRLMRVQPV